MSSCRLNKITQLPPPAVDRTQVRRYAPLHPVQVIRNKWIIWKYGGLHTACYSDRSEPLHPPRPLPASALCKTMHENMQKGRKSPHNNTRINATQSDDDVLIWTLGLELATDRHGIHKFSGCTAYNTRTKYGLATIC